MEALLAGMKQVTVDRGTPRVFVRSLYWQSQRRRDVRCHWHLSQLLKRLRRRLNNPGFWVLFGDQAFPASDLCHKILANADATWKRNYNTSMSKLRISAEWMFKDMGQFWHRTRPRPTDFVV